MRCAPRRHLSAPKRQFEGYEAQWSQANRRSFAYLQYKPKPWAVSLRPPPGQPMADVPVGAITMAMHASDDIKATTGMFDAALGARGPATSGIQEREQKRQGGVANFTTRTTSIVPWQTGRCLPDMIPRLFDTGASRASSGEDETITSAPISRRLERRRWTKKNRKDQDDDQPIWASDRRYDCTVSAGRASRRSGWSVRGYGFVWTKLAETQWILPATSLYERWTGLAPTEIAERIAKTIPPSCWKTKTSPSSNKSRQK